MAAARVGPRERAALLASSVLVGGALLAQAPGRIVPETKLDVLVDPGRFLGRALSAWDPSAGFGRVQNQAAGYLFPMGAFTGLGHLAHVPPWVTQRVWIAVVVLLGFWGAHRLASVVGIASAWGRLVAAWAYAVAPATVGVVAFQSAGQLPYSLAPWVLVPLVGAGSGSDPRRVAARSALAVAAMGGVNGAANFAVLPLAVVWFATRAPGSGRRRLAAWWAAGVVAATTWWLIPLGVSIRYGVRFTAYTEQSTLTTSTESATEVLRGTGNWLTFLLTPAGPWLPGGNALVADRLAIAASVLVAAGAVVGLCRRDLPGRSWLVPSLLVGVVAMGIGYDHAGGGSFAGLAQGLLDGPLAPFRNVHKFSAVVRLPMALAFGHLVASAPAGVHAQNLRRFGPFAQNLRRFGPYALRIGAPVAIVAAIIPAATGRLTAPGSFRQLPRAWRDAAAWIDRHDHGSHTLVLPGSAFGEYVWGRPLDEPLSSLLRSDWAVRDLIPLGGDGSTRLLDGVEAALAGDHLPPAFTATLRRAGVRDLVVRNDLDLVRTSAPAPDTVRRLLSTAPDLRRVASFGSPLGDSGGDERLGPRPGDQPAIRQIDIYQLDDPIPRVAAYPLARSVVVGGGPEALLDLPPALTRNRATVLAVDEPVGALGDPLRIGTDTARRRDQVFGSIRNNVTFTLTAAEPSPLTGQAPQSRWPAGRPVGLTQAAVVGASAIFDNATPGTLLTPGRQPASAFDANRSTAWTPAKPFVGRWLETRFDRPRRVPAVSVTNTATTGQRIGSITVTTDGGTRTATIGASGTVRVPTAPGPTGRVRVTVASMIVGDEVAPPGLAEVRLAGVEVTRTVRTAAAGPRGTPAPVDGVVVERAERDRFDPNRTDEEGTLDRTFTLAAGPRLTLTGTATAAPGPALDAALAEATSRASTATITASASSRWRNQPSFDPAATVDGDRGTAWVSDLEATPPTLSLSWSGAVPVDRLALRPVTGTDPVDQVEVRIGGRRIVRRVPQSGRIEIPRTRSDHLTLSFPQLGVGTSAGRRVGIAEVTLRGLGDRTAARPEPEAQVTLACGQGPTVRIDGRLVPTRAHGRAGDLLDSRPVAWEACDDLMLAAGDHRLLATASAAVAVSTAQLLPVDAERSAGRGRSARAQRWDSQHRLVRVSAGPATIVATTENTNDGWRASLDGTDLRAIRVDGWRQGWIVPAGQEGDITITYRPTTVHRGGLVLGAVAAGALVALALVGVRRRPWSAPTSRRWSEQVGLTLSVVVGVAIGGPLVLLALPLLALRNRSGWLGPLGAGAVLVAGAVAFADPARTLQDQTGSLSLAAQVPAVVAWLAVAVAAVPTLRRSAVSPAGGSTPSSRVRSGRRPRPPDTTSGETG